MGVACGCVLHARHGDYLRLSGWLLSALEICAVVTELYALLGTDDLEQAIENIKAERAAMREIHDENTALKIYNRRLRLIVTYALQVYETVEGDAGIFLTSKAREGIRKSREQIEQAARAIVESKMITESC